MLFCTNKPPCARRNSGSHRFASGKIHGSADPDGDDDWDDADPEPAEGDPLLDDFDLELDDEPDPDPDDFWIEPEERD